MSGHVTRTIAAIATPQGRGGIGVIRLSGTQAPMIAQALTGKPLPIARTAQFAVFLDVAGVAIDEGLVLKNQKLNRGSMVVAAGESMGVYIYGRYEENRFVYEYHFPFLMGSVGTLNDEITIERHLDKESFAAVCDEAKTGVTLIFYLQNIIFMKKRAN